jgi:hypothetical protein
MSLTDVKVSGQSPTCIAGTYIIKRKTALTKHSTHSFDIRLMHFSVEVRFQITMIKVIDKEKLRLWSAIEISDMYVEFGGVK